MDIPFGSLSITTFRKLPKQAPRVKKRKDTIKMAAEGFEPPTQGL